MAGSGWGLRSSQPLLVFRRGEAGFLEAFSRLVGLVFWLLFSTRQKVTLGSGRFRLGASLVTASAGVSAWRGRLFGSLFEACGACFWLLFSTCQKVTLGSGFRLVFFLPVRRLP